MQAWVVARVSAWMSGCAEFVTAISFKRRSGGLITAALTMMALLAGCAEVSYRGGVVAKVADTVVFPATAKSHRALRAYAVYGALVTIANNRGVPTADKAVLQARMVQTLNSIEEAFICAYSSRSGCVFFDEKMARVDYGLYKLAILILIRSETKAMITEVQRELLPKIPVVGSGLAAASSAADAAAHTATAGVETAQIVESLIKLGYDAAVDLGPLFPLYRDVQELDMVVVVDMLARRCVESPGFKGNVPQNNKPFRQNLDDVKFPLPHSRSCDDFTRGMALYRDGNGDLEKWRQFTLAMNADYIADMTPSSDHFIEVSSTILSSCVRLFTDAGMVNTQFASTVMVPTNCKAAILFSDSNVGGPLAVAERSAYGVAKHGSLSPLPVASPVGSTPLVQAKANVGKTGAEP